MADDEFEPFVLFRVQGEQFECALWKLPDGAQAIALFMNEPAAMAYRNGLKYGDDWQVSQPSPRELVQVFKASVRGGIKHAVLDPDPQSANRLFDLEHVLRAMGASP